MGSYHLPREGSRNAGLTVIYMMGFIDLNATGLNCSLRHASLPNSRCAIVLIFRPKLKP
jgi:hypothetical protein